MKIESEKYIEKKLRDEVKKIGGLSLKLLSTHFTGLPDRLCLLPQGRLFFIELKTTSRKPRKIQLKVHQMIRNLGFTVLIIDSSQKIKEFIDDVK